MRPVSARIRRVYTHLALARQVGWLLYVKRPFVSPQQVLDYVRRYRHRVTSSNFWLVDMQDGRVSFRYENPMTLARMSQSFIAVRRAATGRARGTASGSG